MDHIIYVGGKDATKRINDNGKDSIVPYHLDSATLTSTSEGPSFHLEWPKWCSRMWRTKNLRLTFLQQPSHKQLTQADSFIRLIPCMSLKCAGTLWHEILAQQAPGGALTDSTDKASVATHEWAFCVAYMFNRCSGRTWKYLAYIVDLVTGIIVFLDIILRLALVRL
ncbi:hypothetical protein J3R83DRAFT_1735 [Lanmaoa asiatica]|nr:hypothetical protein J3R83DRAFT_1735 [Lanmaoa asiatica]